MPLYESQNISYRYPSGSAFELKRAGLTVEKGDLVGLLGPNGAGKSTLLRLLAGLIPPREGNILFEGEPLGKLAARERAKRISYVPQSVHFAFPLSVLEIVGMGRHPYLGRFESFGKKDQVICDHAMELCDVAQFRDRPYDQLSGGEKQRVLLASALAQTPVALLLDEPTLSLDLSHQILLFEIVRKLHREEGLTVVVATHDLNLAGRFLDRLVLMRGGVMERQGASREILTVENIRHIFGVEIEALKGRDGFPYFIPSSIGKEDLS